MENNCPTKWREDPAKGQARSENKWKTK